MGWQPAGIDPRSAADGADEPDGSSIDGAAADPEHPARMAATSVTGQNQRDVFIDAT